MTADHNGAPLIREPRTVLRRDMVVEHPGGMHLRIASCIAQLTQRQCKITISNGRQECDGSSILEMLTMAAAQGTRLSVTLQGPDAPRVMQAVEYVLKRGELPDKDAVCDGRSKRTESKQTQKETQNGRMSDGGSIESVLDSDFRQSSYSGLRGVHAHHHNGKVLLEGRVPSVYHRQLAITMVRRRLTQAPIDDRLRVASH